MALAKAASATITALYAKATGNPGNYGDLVEPAALERLVMGSEGRSKEYLGIIKIWLEWSLLRLLTAK